MNEKIADYQSRGMEAEQAFKRAGFILLITTYMVMKGAAKLFRVGMLMYGKPASLTEMWKWLRY